MILVFLCGLDSIVLPVVNIALTALIAADCESQILVGTSLSSGVKTCMAWSILSSAEMWGCMRYSCKYSEEYVIINALVFLSIAWIQR